MNKALLNYSITLWYEMTFENSKVAERLFTLIELMYEAVDSYVALSAFEEYNSKKV